MRRRSERSGSSICNLPVAPPQPGGQLLVPIHQSQRRRIDPVNVVFNPFMEDRLRAGPCIFRQHALAVRHLPFTQQSFAQSRNRTKCLGKASPFPGSAVASPEQCNSSKHVASMFLGCSLLVPSFPLLSFPRPAPNAPPPPLDYRLQTPAALPRLQPPPIRFWHQKMPAADSSRFGLPPRRAPASTQPAAGRLDHRHLDARNGPKP